MRDWTTATLGAPTTGVGPSLETAYDASKLNPVSLTRRGDKDGIPATLETDVYSDFQYDPLGRMTRGPDANWYPADSQYDALDRPVLGWGRTMMTLNLTYFKFRFLRQPGLNLEVNRAYAQRSLNAV